MSYRKLFNPDPVQSFRKSQNDYDKALSEPAEKRDGSVYVYDDEVVLHVNVALATGRPLLVRGLPGCGKSSIAPNIARVLQWRYYESVMTSRVPARDLKWRFDAVRRLSDAHLPPGNADLTAYIEPGVLWWAFDRESALRRGAPSSSSNVGKPPRDPDLMGFAKSACAVVLIDEIDKADPDVPNDLLVTLGSLRFTVDETATVVEAAHPPLVVITTNEERDLPTAFLRRCVELKLPEPETSDDFASIAVSHFGNKYKELYDQSRRA